METEPRSTKWHVFFLVAIGIFMSTLDGSIVNIALPAILKDFDTTLTTTEWVVMIYLLSVTAFLLGFGRLGDLKGRKKIYGYGLVVFSLASLFCAMAPDIRMLIAARLLQGVGAAMIMACTPALIVDAFPVEERGRALGLNGAVVACGLTAGPAIGGVLIKLSSWRMIFYINVPIGLVATLFVFRFLAESRGDRTDDLPFDWPGSLSAAAAIGLFLFAVTHGYDWGYASVSFITTLGASGLFFSVFLFLERQSSAPLLDLTLFQNRLFALPALSGVLLFITLFVMIFLMPFYLMLPAGLSSTAAGQILMVPFAFLFFFSPVSGALSDRIGSRILCTTGMTLLTIGLFSLSRLDGTGDFWTVSWRLSLVGIGTAIFISPNSATVMSSVPPENRGVAGAVVASARNLGMVLGVALAGTVFHLVFDNLSGGVMLSDFSPKQIPPFLKAFQAAMIAGTAVGFIAMAIAWMRGEESGIRRQNQTSLT